MITTLVLLFGLAFVLSVFLTPAVRALGIKMGAMDIPAERKIHTKPIPRIGGLAVFLSFAITGLIAIKFCPSIKDLYVFNFDTAMGYLGGLVVLGCGLWDDFRHLKPWTKLLIQIAVATCAFIGGATINSVYCLQLNFIYSYLATVFWILLFINAVNLIDGLDGLAGGLVFFTCAVMTISSYSNQDYLYAFYFVILGGAVLGFLKYNFNPATIFLGDGGSYFLGYTVAIMAIRSSTKSNVGVLMLMPLLALGIPVFDAVLSPIRRFIRGRSMFQADKGHVHHTLLRMGLSSRNVVLIIYGITMGLCVLAMFMMVYRGKGIEGLVLLLLMFGMFLLVQKLGYLEYLAFDKFYGWFKDITDVAGLSHARRSFLSLQIELGKSQNMEELWEVVIEALKMLNFHHAKLYVVGEPVREWKMEEYDYQEKQPEAENEYINYENIDSALRFEIPLREYGSKIFLGKLILIKDLNKGVLEPYTIRRVEHLRRTLIPVLKNLVKTGAG
ncbi:MAG: hypothetical protein APR62_04340 [Smithella sp. SDB]|nr:MAG: hypothetical protein APR62_04340 [Smithella sp. SDB]